MRKIIENRKDKSDVEDMIIKKRHNCVRGESQHLSRLKNDDIKNIRILLRTVDDVAIAKMYNVSRGAIQAIKHNRTWLHVV